MYFWVAYITEGREKYEYHTHLVGVFERVHSAARFMLTKLVEQGKLFGDEEDEKDQKQAVDRLERADEDEVLSVLATIVREANDSFYMDGWDYTITAIGVVR